MNTQKKTINASHHLGLRFKILSLLSIILLGIFTSLTLTLITQNSNSLRSNINEKTKAYATLATPPIISTFLVYKDAGSFPITEQAKKYYELDRDVVSVGIVDTEGRVHYWYGDNKQKSVSLARMNGFDAHYEKNDFGIITKVVQPYVEDYGGYRYAAVYSISPDSVTQQISDITRTLVLSGVILGFFTLLAIYFAINRLYIRPVRELSRLSRIISAGHLDQEIEIKSKDEIGDLSHAVNDMANKLKADILALQESDRLKNEFIMITSHNLRTPLTVIEGYIELIDALKTSHKFREFLDIIKSNTNKLKKLTEDMLTIATIESGGNLTASLDVDITQVINETLEDLEDSAVHKKITIKPLISLHDAKVNISRPHLKSALWNVVENAIKFTSEGGEIAVEARLLSNQALIVVKDQGEGIAREELPRLFTKFHRGTSTLEYNHEGVGLGLYVTKIIFDQFHGEIAIESKQGHGTTVRMRLPIVKKTTQRTTAP